MAIERPSAETSKAWRGSTHVVLDASDVGVLPGAPALRVRSLRVRTSTSVPPLFQGYGEQTVCLVDPPRAVLIERE